MQIINQRPDDYKTTKIIIYQSASIFCALMLPTPKHKKQNYLHKSTEKLIIKQIQPNIYLLHPHPFSCALLEVHLGGKRRGGGTQNTKVANTYIFAQQYSYQHVFNKFVVYSYYERILFILRTLFVRSILKYNSRILVYYNIYNILRILFVRSILKYNSHILVYYNIYIILIIQNILEHNLHFSYLIFTLF
eukprot:TRINITY_DN4247_c1_g1_i11.p3 TRINITY_DN4247_c1_g1~~TRINITY_DN4247_c1_g1_i11.p3  ORF type:complete len:191 (+),score=-14.51 TRINITY_DN4247_c1_g1_i11:205-777(+)